MDKALFLFEPFFLSSFFLGGGGGGIKLDPDYICPHLFLAKKLVEIHDYAYLCVSSLVTAKAPYDEIKLFRINRLT